MTIKMLKLAAKINTSGWPGSDETLAENLQSIRTALLKGRFYVGVLSVAPSGMSRVLRMGYIANNRLWHINNADILKLAGCNKAGRIGGCGSDMMFEAQYNLFLSLCDDKNYQDDMPGYNTLINWGL